MYMILHFLGRLNILRALSVTIFVECFTAVIFKGYL